MGTVKKSIAAITSRWLFRKVDQRFADTGLFGTFRIQRKMSPVIVIVTDVFTHRSVQMAFVEYDDIIEQISPAVSNPAFCYAVLPRLRKLLRFGRMPKLFTVLMTSSLKFAARSKIK